MTPADLNSKDEEAFMKTSRLKWFVERNNGIRQVCSRNNVDFCIGNLTKQVAFTIVDEHNQDLEQAFNLGKQEAELKTWKEIASIIQSPYSDIEIFAEIKRRMFNELKQQINEVKNE